MKAGVRILEIGIEIEKLMEPGNSISIPMKPISFRSPSIQKAKCGSPDPIVPQI
jgi:hypothetical protein